MNFGDIKDDAVDLAKGGFGKGLGVMAGIVGTDFAVSRLLTKNGVPMVPANLGPLAVAGLGVAGGLALEHVPGVRALSKWIDPKMFAAGAIGVALAGYVGKFLSPVMDASSNAASSAAAANSATAGFGFGRAFSRGMAGLGGLGHLPPRGALYAKGVRNLQGGRMFNGAPVQIQETTGGRPGMHGANVQFEQGAMAGFFTH